MDRRRAPRHSVVFPLMCNPGSPEESAGISRNISTTGILMATTTKVEVGAPITVVLRVRPNAPSQRTVQGRIVRVEQNDDPSSGQYPLCVAVDFDEPVEELDELLADARSEA